MVILFICLDRDNANRNFKHLDQNCSFFHNITNENEKNDDQAMRSSTAGSEKKQGEYFYQTSRS